MQVAVRNLVGDEVGQIELDDYIFGIEPNMAVIQQAVLRQQANARQGTHNTKTRADVRGGGRKPWRQKGTGRARQGSTRSPQWAHGGVAFGPHTRSYEQDMPRKMRRLAIRSVLSAKAAGEQIVVVENFDDLEPRTKAMQEALGNLNVNVGEQSALIMTAAPEDNLEKAAGNLSHVKTMPVNLFSVVDMLKFDYLVMPRASLDIITNILGNTGGRRKLVRVESSSEAAYTPGAAKTKKARKPAKAAVEVEEAAPGATAEPAEAPSDAAPAKSTRKSSAASRRKAADAETEEAVESVTFAPTGVVQELAEETVEPVEPATGTATEEGSEKA